MDRSMQVENTLDLCLRNRRVIELSFIVDEVQTLRESATNMDDAIEELDMKLSTLKGLAVDVCTQRCENGRIFSVVFLYTRWPKKLER